MFVPKERRLCLVTSHHGLGIQEMKQVLETNNVLVLPATYHNNEGSKLNIITAITVNSLPF